MEGSEKEPDPVFALDLRWLTDPGTDYEDDVSVFATENQSVIIEVRRFSDEEITSKSLVILRTYVASGKKKYCTGSSMQLIVC